MDPMRAARGRKRPQGVVLAREPSATHPPKVSRVFMGIEIVNRRLYGGGALPGVAP